MKSDPTNPRLLIVDDEKVALANMEHILEGRGYEIVSTNSGPKALKLIDKQEFDIVVTDLSMPKVDGMDILERCCELHPNTQVIVITGHATIDSAIEAMKKGAYYYIAKPFRLDEVRKVVAEAAEKNRLKKENLALRKRLEHFQGHVQIITQNLKMEKLLEMARQMAPTDCNILVTGESGTGKEVLAKYIHGHSLRSEGPLLAINCGAFNENLLTNELFGHEKGAFTGADFQKKGLIETASHGTLFLDEIAEMPPAMQIQLLRVIQEKKVLRLGGTKPLDVDVRFIAATNRDPQDAVKKGILRADLFFRLNVVLFHIPPLSGRKDDIPLLIQYVLKEQAEAMKKDVRDVSPEFIKILMNYEFPGNIRELENIIARAVALCQGNTLEPVHLPEDIRELEIWTFRNEVGGYSTLGEHEKMYILWILKKEGGNKTRAAEALGIDRISLWRKLKRYNLEDDSNSAG